MDCPHPISRYHPVTEFEIEIRQICRKFHHFSSPHLCARPPGATSKSFVISEIRNLFLCRLFHHFFICPAFAHLLRLLTQLHPLNDCPSIANSKKVRGSDKKSFKKIGEKNWKILEWAGSKLQDSSLQYTKQIFSEHAEL